jgi:predicted anti-sigma-YlaC factor YlaD
MKDKTCREFQEWLDCLPNSQPTEEMKQHFADCTRCRKLFDSLAPLVQALSEIPPPAKLSDEKIKRLAAVAKKEAFRAANRRTVWQLSRNITMALPFIIAVHWLWLDLGSRALAARLSPLIAQIFSILIILTSSLAAASLFGAVPLLWTGLRRNL